MVTDAPVSAFPDNRVDDTLSLSLCPSSGIESRNFAWLPDDPGNEQGQSINTVADGAARQLTQPLDQSTYDPSAVRYSTQQYLVMYSVADTPRLRRPLVDWLAMVEHSLHHAATVHLCRSARRRCSPH